ncbi:non-homologous end-joining factor 1-like [Vespula squamosa]|uniref:Non-homologous end-joining factor 1 n=1 Tax=Vespula squamosa TaxID=30214 RepID=A0ABD2BA88_VESSQ
MAVNFNQNDLGKIWKKINIQDDLFIICVTKENNAWKILLTNFKEIWSECLTNEKILTRSKKLNSILIISDNEHMEVVLDTLTDIPKYAVEASVDHIKLLKNFEGGRFKFEVNFSKGTTEEFWENVTKPLYLSSIELMRRQNILTDLIKRKDQEIAEYKAEGAELIRKNIETKVFNENQLNMHAIEVDENNYIDSFQTVVEFYNKTLSKQCVKIEKRNSVVSINAIEQENQSIPDTFRGYECTITKDEPENKCGKSSLQSDSNSKSKRDKKNKISTINIAPIVIPSKRSKDSVTDIIL